MKKILFSIIVAFFLYTQVNWSQGCIESTSDEGVQVIGYIQPEFRYDFLGEDKLTGDNLEQSSFYFNRLRLGVVGSIPYDYPRCLCFLQSVWPLGQSIGGSVQKSVWA